MSQRENNGQAAAPKSALHWCCENLESIIWAIIFALVIRAFIMEAFQIPTGSMATSFYGMHLDIACKNCGYSYSWGNSSSVGGRIVPGHVGSSLCPLCQDENPAPRRARTKSGDKIMVFKHFNNYSPLERYQVVVFKSPTDLRKNYIKRLIAMGGEKLQLVGGDVYINGQIARKPLKVQRRLWQPVYRSGFAERRATDDGQRWLLNDGWSEDHGAFACQTDGMASMRLAKPVYDDYGYNDAAFSGEYRLKMGGRPHVVGDLKIAARIAEMASSPSSNRPAGLELVLEENSVLYALQAVLAQGDPSRIEGLRIVKGDRSIDSLETGDVLKAVPLSVPAVGVRLGFANFDNRLCAWMDGKLVMEVTLDEGAVLSGQPVDTRSSSALIVASGVRVVVDDLRVDRDVHYFLPGGSFLDHPPEGTNTKTVEDRRYLLAAQGLHVSGEQLVFDAATSTVHVPPHALIAMGDNCPISNDSRMWGPVPYRFLLGKAFLVWWPLNRIRMVR